ncbi:hypothetical protein RclHR1_04900002 [Rhizophagus clarus]|uniref:Uncharacterized protein n=1 Tax=Rhizophagus clarus TaxID=94130 RepID=A0A2Z6SDL6_9GLOM|nr:hypothetical protein RclHR1_04900002 [Rhizophagus clarus]GES79905.1 hypothetical protein GLOIN_2v1766554 [Rhizophagus clarus]
MCVECRKIVTLDDFLTKIDYENLKQLNGQQILAYQTSQPLHRFKLLNGKDLLNIYLESEAIRLKVHDKFLVKLALYHIWITNLNLRDKLLDLADDVNKINLNKKRVCDENLNRIIRIDVPQMVNSIFEEHIFNGVKDFSNNDDKNVGFGCL